MVATADAEQRQPEGAFLDRFLVPFDRAELSPVPGARPVARYLRLNGATRLSDVFDQARGARAPAAGLGGIVATPFQHSAVMALAASSLGVAPRVVVGAEPGPRGLVDSGDVHLVGRAPVRRRHLGFPGPGTGYVATRIASGRAGSAAWFRDSTRTRSTSSSRQGPRDPPAGRVLHPDGPAKATRPAWQAVLAPLLLAAGLRLAALPLVPLVKALGAAPSSDASRSRLLRHRVAGSPRRCPRPRHARAGLVGQGRPGVGARAAAGARPAGGCRRLRTRTGR